MQLEEDINQMAEFIEVLHVAGKLKDDEHTEIMQTSKAAVDCINRKDYRAALVLIESMKQSILKVLARTED